ncbi:MAG: hypothetical protein AAF567_00295 [Actinomycetota bacterium]
MATEPITIETSDGEQLQGELFVPDAPRGAMVICHPHPLHGGDMYTPVPAALFQALEGLGLAGVRFNFRGVGRSTGTHDEGRAERLDVAAALDTLAAAVPDVPLFAGGWSFGADVSLACDDDRIAGWFLAAAVLRVVDPDEMAARSSAAPKRFAIGEVDQFASPDVIEPRLEGWTNASTVVIPGADHFFGGVMRPVVDAFADFVTGCLPE